MAKNGITVKVATDKVIKLLEAKLREMDNHKANYNKLMTQEKKELDAWKKTVIDYAKKNFNKSQEPTIEMSYYGMKTVRVVLSFPAEGTLVRPERKDITSPDSYQFKEDYEDISQAIKLLKLTDEETISTATYRNITRFL